MSDVRKMKPYSTDSTRSLKAKARSRQRRRQRRLKFEGR